MTAQQSTPNKPDAAVAAIEYAIGQGIDAATFLTCWMHGDFDVIRREWPDAPEAVFRGADPLYPSEPSESALSTTQGQADAHLRALLRYTESFYSSAIKHGMKASSTANAIAHVERAGKAMHQIIHAQARILAKTSNQPQDAFSVSGV